MQVDTFRKEKGMDCKNDQGNMEDSHEIDNSMAEHHRRTEKIMEKHLKAMYEELTKEFAVSLYPESKHGLAMERFIKYNQTGDKNGTFTTVCVEGKMETFHFDQDVPAPVYEGVVKLIVHLEGRMTGSFPLDMHLTVEPFDHKQRWIDDTHERLSELSCLPALDSFSESDALKEIEFEAECKLDEIQFDLEKLEEETWENRFWKNEDRFWERADEIEDRVRDAENLIYLVLNAEEEVEQA